MSVNIWPDSQKFQGKSALTKQPNMNQSRIEVETKQPTAIIFDCLQIRAWKEKHIKRKAAVDWTGREIVK